MSCAIRVTSPTPVQAFQAIGRNDQLLWVSLSYVLYSIANVATTGFMIYLFKFVLRLPDSYSIVGIIAFVVGLIVTPLYPAINRRVPRRYLYLGGMVLMAIAYILFILFSTKPHDRFHRPGSLLPARHVHPDDRDPDNHGLCRVRPAQDRQAQRSRDPVCPTHAGQDRRRPVQPPSSVLSPSRPP